MKKYNVVILLIISTILLTSLYSPATAATPEKEERVFRWQFGFHPPPLGHWNPYAPNYLWRTAEGQIYEPLFYYIYANDTLIPWLAESYEITPDYMKLTIHLRKGIKWHDGTEFTSKDVLCTFYVGYVPESGMWAYVDRIEAPDDYTVVVYFKKPHYFLWKDILTHCIYPYSMFGEFYERTMELIRKNADVKEFTALVEELREFRPEKPIGTGPFTPIIYTADQLIIERAEKHYPGWRYWREALGLGKCYFDKVIRFSGAGETGRINLLNARVDFAESTPRIPEIHYALRAQANTRVITVPYPAGAVLLFNCSKYPLSLPEVRRAIAYAINREDFAVATAIIVPDHGFATEIPVGFSKALIDKWLSEEFIDKYIDKYEYNPDKAIEILESLGFKRGPDGIWVTPNGTRLSFKMTGFGYGDWVAGADIIVACLRDIGIEVEYTATDPAVAREVTEGRRRVRADIMMEWWWSSYPPIPLSWYHWLFVDLRNARKIRGLPHWCPDIYEVPWIGKVNATEWAIEAVTKPDPEEQKKYVEVLAYIVNHYMVALQLYEKGLPIYVHESRVIGWPEDPNDPWWYSFCGYWYKWLGYAICSGMLRPRELVKPTAMPKETLELINASYKAITELKTSIEDTTNAIEALRGDISALSSQLSSVYGIMVAILLLEIIAIVLVVTLARRTPR